MEITDYIYSHRQEVLLVGDYNAYHTYATRRLHKLRKKLGQTTPKGRKYTAKPLVKAEDVGKDATYAHLLLLGAERAWAQAMHEKSTHSADPSATGIAGSARRHIISRLNKAIGYAKHLVLVLHDQSASGASEADILESRAYLASLAGAVALEKQQWEHCLREYSVARVIYASLGQITKKEAFRDLLSGTVDPSLRYAAYQMKLPRTKPVTSLAIDFFPSDPQLRSEVVKMDPACLSAKGDVAKRTAEGEPQELPENITWRSRTVALQDATISQALAAAAAAESRLTSWLAEPAGSSASPKDKAAAYDQVIICSQDAVDATKTAIEDLTNEGVDLGDARMQALQITRTAVNYGLIGWRVGRNRVLCGEQDGLVVDWERAKPSKTGKDTAARDEGNGKKLTRLREQVVMYDSTLQSLDFILELPGVAADSSFVRELEAKRSYFRALRCLAVGRSHSLLGKFPNALALYARASELASIASASLQTSTDATGPPRLEISSSQIASLESTLRGLVAQHRGLVTLEKLSTQATATKTAATGRPFIIERMNDYAGDEVDLTRLVPYPPTLQPVPVKPLFLDVAWNYIDYPRDQAAVSVRATGAAGPTPTEPTPEEPKAGGRRGWFGFGR